MTKLSSEEKELTALLATKRGLKDERVHLRKRKAELLDEQRDLGNQNIEDLKVRQRQGDISIGLTLIDARLAKLEVSPDLFDKIDGLVRVLEREYNLKVVAAREAAFEAMIVSQLPFFDGDEPSCRDFWNRVRPPHPMLYKFGKAYRHHPTGAREHRDIVAEAASFLAKRERNSKLLGLD